MHHHSCRVLKDIQLELAEPDSDEIPVGVSIDAENKVMNNYTNSLPNTKVGINLAKSDAQWGLADIFFRAYLPFPDANNTNVNECIELFNSTMYSYFRDTYGTVTYEVVPETRQEFRGLIDEHGHKIR